MTNFDRSSNLRNLHTGRSANLSGPTLVVLTVFLAVITLLGAPASSRAETGNTDEFMPSTWHDGAKAGRTAARKVDRDNDDEPTVRRSRSHRRAATSRAANAATSKAASAAANYDDGSRPQRRGRVAATSRPARALTGGSVAWRVSSGCLASNLRSVIDHVASAFGAVTVNSTCRSPGHNRAVGGASKSWHLTGQAADIRVHGNYAAASSYMRGQVGGFKHYGGGRFHIDNGPTRTF